MMDFTPKQERNGSNMGGGGRPSPVPSADLTGDISGAMGQAESAAAAWAANGRVVFEGGGQDGVVSFEWDAGLAINDVEGGGSG